LETLITAIRTRENIAAALFKFYTLFSDLKGIEANCHFAELALSLESLSTEMGIAKVAYRVASHVAEVTTDVRGIYSKFREGDYKGAGVLFGDFIKLALNYSTI